MSLGGKTAHLLPCCMCMPSNVTEFIGSGPAARRRSRPAAPPSNVVLHSDRRMQSILSGRPPSAVPTRRHPRIIQVWSLPPKDFTASIEPVRSNPLRCTASARSFRRPFATRINAATNKPKLSIDRPLTHHFIRQGTSAARRRSAARLPNHPSSIDFTVPTENPTSRRGDTPSPHPCRSTRTCRGSRGGQGRVRRSFLAHLESGERERAPRRQIASG